MSLLRSTAKERRVTVIKKDLLGLKDLTKTEIIKILDTAADMKEMVTNPQKRTDILRQVSVITLFYENSTRTKMSFIMAGEYLGAKIDDLNISTSSVNKGESLVDMGINLDHMGVNIMIMRHQMTGAPHLLAKHVKASVINAGDGTNEHPTQSLLDLFTIRERLGGFEDLKVTILGDVSHSRVARSNIFGLKKLGAKVMLAGPSTLVTSDMEHLGVALTTDIKEAVSDADVIIALRIQLERQRAINFPDTNEYTKLFGITPKIIKFAKKGALIMHPGPVNRGVELSADVIDSNQSVIYTQVQNGVAVRMALLKLLSG